MKKNNVLKYLIFASLLFLANANVVSAVNEYIVCGDNSIPAPVPPITRVIVLVLQIVLPLVIIIMGSVDFLKAVVAADQDKIKKTQNQFIKRLGAGAIFFFVIVVVKFAISLTADSSQEAQSIWKCVDCMIGDEASCGPVTTDNPFLNDI